MFIYFPVENTRMILFFSSSRLVLIFIQSVICLNENNIYLWNDKCLTTVLKFGFRRLSDMLFKFHGTHFYDSLGVSFGSDQ